MTKLEQLIAELCPDGVEYRKLSEILNIQRGIRVVKNQLKDTGKYPVYQNSLTPMGYHTDSNFPANTAFIIGAGAAGEVGYSDVDFWAADDCFCIVCQDDYNSRFLFHYLLSQQDFLLSKVRKASIPRLSRTVIENLKIPFPPLPVQSEIVRILDNFTELTVELTVELTARKKQYEYYRNILLDVDEKVCTVMTIGDIYEFKYGTGNNIPTGGGEYPVYGGNGIAGYHTEYNSEDSPVIGHIGAYAGLVKWAAGKHFVTYNGVICKHKNDMVNAKYAYYLLLIQDFLSSQKGAQPFVSYSSLKSPIVKIPPMAEQERIVDILDRFDTLCNDISEGLPAEIEGRRKQYEYYRDKLLTFKELSK